MTEAKPIPRLQTERLVLRAFELTDASDVQQLAGDPDIALMTANIPHPYSDGLAEEWIAGHAAQFEAGELAPFAIALRGGGALIGSISLGIDQRHDRAELGYWIGKPWWNHGYCTEAARTVLRYAFDVLGLNRIHAWHFRRNPASGRVMQKIGMRHEGSLPQHVKRDGRFEDLESYGILRQDHKML